MSYTAPTSVDEACQILRTESGSRVFAGATDLLPQARAGRGLPEVMVDLKRIPRLSQVSRVDTRWTIGAAVPAVRLFRDEPLRADFPGLAEGIGLIGSDQIQSRASLGGNLCNASPAADTGPSLVVNEALAVVASAHGERQIPVSSLTVGPGRTSLEEGELVVEFLIDRPSPRRSDAYLRFTPRTEMDIAVVGVAARVELAETGECAAVDVVLGAVAPTTMRVEGIADVLVGRVVDDETLESAADLSRAAATPIDDRRGTKEFRRHITGVLTKRAIAIAVERAGSR